MLNERIEKAAITDEIEAAKIEDWALIPVVMCNNADKLKESVG